MDTGSIPAAEPKLSKLRWYQQTLRCYRFSLMMILLGAVSLAGCIPRPSPVLHFVIPSGFRGAIQIVYGSPDASAPEVVGNRMVYRIPADGVLKAKSDAPFAAWH